MRKVLTIFIIIAASCTNKKAAKNKALEREMINLPAITAINAGFPVSLSNINLQDSTNNIRLNEAAQLQIEQLVTAYYFNDCAGDSSQAIVKMDEVYIHTICVKDSLQTIYWVLLNQMPGEKVNSKVLFYNNQAKQFLHTA